MKLALKELENLPVELIEHYRITRNESGIPEHLKDYIRELNKSAEIFAYQHNVSRAAKLLQASFPYLTNSTARRRLYDAINRFHLNSTVTEEAWNNYYADRLEDLYSINLADNNWTEARRCIIEAKKYRIEAAIKRMDPDLFRLKVQIIDPTVTAERLGLEEFNLKKIWLDTNTFIEELPVDQNNKSKIKKEASQNLGVEYTDYEDIE